MNIYSVKKASNPIPTESGHELFLRGLEAAGAIVTLQELDTNETFTGTIKHCDSTTISLRVDREDGTYQIYVMFKHAIKKFWVDPNNQPPKLKVIQ